MMCVCVCVCAAAPQTKKVRGVGFEHPNQTLTFLFYLGNMGAISAAALEDVDVAVPVMHLGTSLLKK